MVGVRWTVWLAIMPLMLFVGHVTSKSICTSDLLTGAAGYRITASGVKDAQNSKTDYSTSRAILNTNETTDANGVTQMGAWSPEKQDANQYIQVEFVDPVVVQGLLTQGRNGCCPDWVTEYTVQTSTDCQTWHDAHPTAGGATFAGNFDQDSIVQHDLTCPTVARCIRIKPSKWNSNIAMRIGISGCPIRTSPYVPITTPPTVTKPTTPLPSPLTDKNICTTNLLSMPGPATTSTMTSSSDKSSSDPANVYDATRGILNTKEEALPGNGQAKMGAWVANTDDKNQYLQVEFNVPHIIRSVATQGRNGCCQDWVTEYNMEYSYDCQHWVPIQTSNGTSFTGNTDQDTIVQHELPCPIWAKCVRLQPKAWSGHVAMRVDLLGCPISQTPAKPSPLHIHTSQVPSTATSSAFVPIVSGSPSSVPLTSTMASQTSTTAIVSSSSVSQTSIGQSSSSTMTSQLPSSTMTTTVASHTSTVTTSTSASTTTMATSTSSSPMTTSVSSSTTTTLPSSSVTSTSPSTTTMASTTPMTTQTVTTQPSSTPIQLSTTSASLTTTTPPTGCNEYLVSGKDPVLDSQLSASTVYHDTEPKDDYGPARSRLNMTEVKDASGGTKAGSWSTGVLDKNQFIQVHLNKLSTICAVVTQGTGCCQEWVTKYTVSYSKDGSHWQYVGGATSPTVFDGNVDKDSLKINNLPKPITAQYVQIHPVDWHGYISMRFDLQGVPGMHNVAPVVVNHNPHSTTANAGTSGITVAVSSLPSASSAQSMHSTITTSPNSPISQSSAGPSSTITTSPITPVSQSSPITTLPTAVTSQQQNVTSQSSTGTSPSMTMMSSTVMSQQNPSSHSSFAASSSATQTSTAMSTSITSQTTSASPSSSTTQRMSTLPLTTKVMSLTPPYNPQDSLSCMTAVPKFTCADKFIQQHCPHTCGTNVQAG